MTDDPNVIFPNAVLYILMRTDMESMNAGKGMAQAAHAANLFAHHWGGDDNTVTAGVGYMDWLREGGGFGTTIVLSVFGESELRYYLANAQQLGHPVGIILDKTYPIVDGCAIHSIPVHTCGYVFVKNRHENGGALIEGLELHP